MLAGSLSASSRLGDTRPLALIRGASVQGKYRHLLHVLHAPDDQPVYDAFKDFGFWNGTSYGAEGKLEPGHWVYLYPRWFVWRDGPPPP